MKIFLDMVGCRLNQSEIEAYARQFRLAGHSLVSSPAAADLVVINTCTVTSAAASDSRQKIRQAARSGAGQIIVTGCEATLNPEQISGLHGVTQVIVNSRKDELVAQVLGLPQEQLDYSSTKRLPIPGARLRTRAFIKVQDGCDNHCTYCITRLVRGSARSRRVEDVLVDIQSALNGGCQEVVLTGVHLGSWGCDFDPPAHLSDLIQHILEATSVPRLHLSSIEPWDISPGFFDLWQDDRLCRHLHLPLQSGCSMTLQRMGRKITPHVFARLVEQARTAIPGVSITTDIITGFPGESESEFAKSLSFVEEMHFTGGHVFTYSPRPGTPAANLTGQVNLPVSKHRNARMRQILRSSATDFQQQHLGREVRVLWEKAIPVSDHQWSLSGLSDNYLRLRAISSFPCQNQIAKVHITKMERDGLFGEILNNQSQHLPN